MTALIIDDDPIIQLLVSTMLASKKYDVTSADSEESLGSLLSVTQPNFDLILIDLQLVEVSGYDVYSRHVKDRFPDSRVIFMSANSKEDAISLYSIPEDANFLEKPFKAPDLFELL